MATIISALNVSPGAAGQVLTSNGSGAKATFQTVGSTAIAALAYLSAPVSNVTGDGTLYSVVFNTTASPGYNFSSAFNTGTGKYVAQATGRHHLDIMLELTNLGASPNDYLWQLVVTGTSAATYVLGVGNPTNMANAAFNLGLTASLTIFMTLGDTATVQVQASGASKTVGLSGVSGGNPNGTMIAGYFVG